MQGGGSALYPVGAKEQITTTIDFYWTNSQQNASHVYQLLTYSCYEIKNSNHSADPWTDSFLELR